jgi:hypothetical protein
MAEPPKGSGERMNSTDPAAKTTAAKVQEGNATRNPKAKVPSDLYPDPPGVTDETPGGRDD